MIKNTYDSLGRITDINHSRGENILADYHYKWDAANRITEINDDKYGYDKTNQLLSAVYAKKPKEQYAYDLNGNRLTALLQGQEKKYETGNFNRLLSENGEKLEYDAEGNRIAKGDIKYFWDHRNRLIKVTTPSETIEYTYDYQNRLVKRSAGKNTTHFIHDGWQIVRQCENSKPVKRFLWGTKQDELLCDNDNWTLGDHLNTIREVVDASGKTLAHCDYNAFGKRLNPSSDTLSFAYTGKLIDNTTGLQWNINRWYDANVGRWISEDPIGFKGKDSNFYRYVFNMAILRLDVKGLRCCPVDNPASSYSCCKKFERFYDAFPPAGIAVGATDADKADACADSLISGVWWMKWGGLVGASVVGTAAAVGGSTSIAVTIFGATFSLPASALITITGAAGGFLSYEYARQLICNSYVCSRAGGSPSCFCMDGYIADVWTCRCRYGADIYTPDSDGRYLLYPGGGGNVIENWDYF